MSDIYIGTNNKGLKVFVNEKLLEKFSLADIRAKLKVVSWDKDPVLEKKEVSNDKL